MFLQIQIYTMKMIYLIPIVAQTRLMFIFTLLFHKLEYPTQIILIL